MEYIEVDSIQPSFRWESFVQALESDATLQAELRGADNIVYDIEILKAYYSPRMVGVVGEEVYYRYGLKEPYHEPDIALEECTKYYWRYRARFHQDNNNYATEWAAWWRSGTGLPADNRRRFYQPKPADTVADVAEGVLMLGLIVGAILAGEGHNLPGGMSGSYELPYYRFKTS